MNYGRTNRVSSDVLANLALMQQKKMLQHFATAGNLDEDDDAENTMRLNRLSALRQLSSPSIMDYYSAHSDVTARDVYLQTLMERTLNWRLRNRMIYNLKMHSLAGFKMSPFAD